MSKRLLSLIVLMSAGAFFLGALDTTKPDMSIAKTTADQRLIVISDITAFKKLQEPPVVFNHSKHVAELEQEGCVRCHPADDKSPDRLKFVYPKERNEKSRRLLLNSYHNDCVGCHNDRVKQGKEAGPIACGECHVPKAPEAWVRPVTFHYGLHNQHEKATEKKCELCHHIYDEAQKKIIYKQETESSCRDCHRDQDQENRRAYRKVAHADCINCHLQKGREAKKAGPTACEKCHLELKLPAVKELTDVPRPDRKQPKTTLIKVEGGGMKEVFFDHENHQMNTITCRSCHHETLSACDKCHTLKGSAEGAGITVEEAYHTAASAWSCNGCHRSNKAAETCAGCHLIMRTDEMSKNVCVVCHTGPVEKAPETPALSQPENLIADKVEVEMKIGALEKEYDPAKFPHLQIVKKLTETSNNNKLSRQFHVEQVTLCKGCHHASAVEPKTAMPKCGSCHKEALDPQDLSKPRLLAVYHLQCLGCHEKMNLKQECKDCHVEKQQQVGTAQPETVSGNQ